MSDRQKIRVGWLNMIEKHSSNPRTKDLLCPSSEDFVSSRTLTKCGPKNAPLIGGLCHAADFDQMWSKMCPSLEDFVSSQTSTKCGPIMRPSLEDFVTLRTFDQIWSIMRPSLEDFVASRTFWQTAVDQQTNKSKQTVYLIVLSHWKALRLLRSVIWLKHWQNNDTTRFHANLLTNDTDRACQSQPNSTASYNDVNGKHSYMIYLDYLKIFGYVRWSFGWWCDDSGVCLSLDARAKHNGKQRRWRKICGVDGFCLLSN
jgi:hypothetical protein